MSSPDEEREGEGERQQGQGEYNNNNNAVITKFMIEKALWNSCVSLSQTEILPNLYIGG